MKTHQIDKQTIYTYLEEINDPEVPVLSIIDLGIVRDVKMNDEGLEVLITPTYTGCPAMDMITATIKIQLATLGFKKIKITQVLSPAWTTEWMSEEGKRKLKEYGIAPPIQSNRFAIKIICCCRSCSVSTLQFLSYTSHQRVWFYRL
jgi:ring-1,2-phenylacetyl-CoA epoxidase subunit PaaD